VTKNNNNNNISMCEQVHKDTITCARRLTRDLVGVAVAVVPLKPDNIHHQHHQQPQQQQQQHNNKIRFRSYRTIDNHNAPQATRQCEVGEQR
jgi:hypothetical protein